MEVNILVEVLFYISMAVCSYFGRTVPTTVKSLGLVHSLQLKQKKFTYTKSPGITCMHFVRSLFSAPAKCLLETV